MRLARTFQLWLAIVLANFMVSSTVASPAWAALDDPKYVNYYIDKNGKVVAACATKCAASDFHEGLALLDSRTVSYLDHQGKIAIVTQLDSAYDFSEGLAGAGEKGKMGFIDKTGVFIIPRRFERVLPFREGLAPVMINDKCGFIDRTGDLIIDALYDNAACFSEGLAPVDVEGKIGFIDKKGKWQIKPQFDQVEGFSNGVAIVTTNLGSPRTRYIDRTGVCVREIEELPPYGVPYRGRFESYTGMFSLNSERFGQPKLGDDWSFAEGLAPLFFKGKAGFINTSGEFAIEPRFDRTYPFAEGMGLIWVKGKYGFVDKSGSIVIEPKFENAKGFSEGLAAVAVSKNKWGFIDKRGSFVIRPRYWDASPFSDGVAHVLKSDPCVCDPPKKTSRPKAKNKLKSKTE